MQVQENTLSRAIKEDYYAFSQSSEPTKEISYRFYEIDFKILFRRGYDVYPLSGCSLIFEVKNSINFSSNDERIKKLFNEIIVKFDLEKDSFHFSGDHCDRFLVNYFPDETSIQKAIADEDRKNRNKKNPKQTCFLS